MVSIKSCCWSITINNPTTEDNQQITLLSTKKWVKEWKGQLEKGAEGTEHIQGMLRTESVRFTQVKKALTRAHIEVAKNPIALAQYVQKEDTRVGAIEGYKPITPKEFYKALLAETKQKQETNLDFCDRISKNLIEGGAVGLEYWISNPNIRSALKNFLSSILHREKNATPQVHEEAKHEGEEDDAEGTSAPFIRDDGSDSTGEGTVSNTDGVYPR